MICKRKDESLLLSCQRRTLIKQQQNMQVAVPALQHLSILQKDEKVVVLIGEFHLSHLTKEERDAYADKFCHLPSHVRQKTIQSFIDFVMKDREAKNLFLEINKDPNDPSMPDTSRLTSFDSEESTLLDLAVWAGNQKDIKSHWIDPRSQIFQERVRESVKATNPVSNLLTWLQKKSMSLLMISSKISYWRRHPEKLKTRANKIKCNHDVTRALQSLKTQQVLKDILQLTKGELFNSITETLSEFMMNEMTQKSKTRWTELSGGTRWVEKVCELTFFQFFLGRHGRVTDFIEDVRAVVAPQELLVIENDDPATFQDNLTRASTLICKCIDALTGLNTRLRAFLVDVYTVERLHRSYVKTAVMYMGAAHTSLTESILVELGFTTTHSQQIHTQDPMLIDTRTVQSAMLTPMHEQTSSTESKSFESDKTKQKEAKRKAENQRLCKERERERAERNAAAAEEKRGEPLNLIGVTRLPYTQLYKCKLRL